MRVILATRSPVHIGTGLVYHPSEYIREKANDGGMFIWRLNISALARSFTKEQRDDFVQRMDDAAYGEKFSLTEFIRGHGIKPLPFRVYRLANRSGDKEPDEIRECIKSAGVPYIPGSSLKGAIRTALLWWHARDDDAFPESIESDLGDRRRCKKKEIGNEYVGSVFGLKPTQGNHYDPQYDLLRFLQVSDCMPDDHWLTCEGIHTYSLSQDRLARKNYTLYAECINGTFSGRIGGLEQIGKVIQSREMPLLGKKMQLLGIRNPADTRGVSAHPGNVLSGWSRWCLEKEKEIVSRDRNGEFLRSLSEAEAWLRDGPHVRLGFSVGTLYQTLIGLLEEKDPGLAEQVIRRCSLGKVPRRATQEGIEPPYPKSVEFTVTGRRPMGWVSVTIEGQ